MKAATETPAGCTHVLAWLPPHLITEDRHGWWELHQREAYDTGEPQKDPDMCLTTARDAPVAGLEEWVAGKLGRPVALAPGTLQIRRSFCRLPAGRWQDAPVYYVTPRPCTSQTVVPGAGGQLTLTRHDCVSVTCPRCGGEPDDEENPVRPHFAGEAEARQMLTGWYHWRAVPADGGEQLVCPRCADAGECARLGHDPQEFLAWRHDDGTLYPASSHCRRCRAPLTPWTPPDPPPPGYPAPDPRRLDLYWDAAAFPAGEVIAQAAAVLLTAASTAGAAVRWDAWEGDQSVRPEEATCDPAHIAVIARAIAIAALQASLTQVREQLAGDEVQQLAAASPGGTT